MVRLFRRRCLLKSRRRSGATLVEMAFVAPIVFLLIIGLIEFARLLMVQQALTNAAREGCRRASLANSVNTADVDAAVRTALQGTIRNPSDTSVVRVTVSPSIIAGMESGTVITTSVEVNYSDVSLTPPWFLGSSVIRGESKHNRE